MHYVRNLISALVPTLLSESRAGTKTPCQRSDWTEPLGIWPMLTKYTFKISKLARAQSYNLAGQNLSQTRIHTAAG